MLLLRSGFRGASGRAGSAESFAALGQCGRVWWSSDTVEVLALIYLAIELVKVEAPPGAA